MRSGGISHRAGGWLAGMLHMVGKWVRTHGDDVLGHGGAVGHGLVAEDAAGEDLGEGQVGGARAVGQLVRGDGVPQLRDQEEVCGVSRNEERAVTGTRAGYDLEGRGLSEEAGCGVNGVDADEIGTEIGHQDEGVCRVNESLVRVRRILSTRVRAGCCEREGEFLEELDAARGEDGPTGESRAGAVILVSRWSRYSSRDSAGDIKHRRYINLLVSHGQPLPPVVH
jgi:hypothetical protein